MEDIGERLQNRRSKETSQLSHACKLIITWHKKVLKPLSYYVFANTTSLRDSASAGEVQFGKVQAKFTAEAAHSRKATTRVTKPGEI